MTSKRIKSLRLYCIVAAGKATYAVSINCIVSSVTVLTVPLKSHHSESAKEIETLEE